MANKFTVKKVLSLTERELSNLSRNDLKQAYKVMADSANKRLKRLSEATGTGEVPLQWSSATTALAKRKRAGETETMTSAGRKGDKLFFGGGSKYTNSQLKSQIKSAGMFISAKTSSRSKWISSMQAQEERLGVHFFGNEDANRFWHIYNKAKEGYDQNVLKKSGFDSHQVMKMLAKLYQEDKNRFDEFGKTESEEDLIKILRDAIQEAQDNYYDNLYQEMLSRGEVRQI